MTADGPGAETAAQPASTSIHSAVSRSAEDLVHLGACELARLIADRAVSSHDVVQAHLQRIELVNPKINAVTERRFDAALVEARQADEVADAGGVLPPLHGVPISVKQMLDVAGLETGWGTTGPHSGPASKDAVSVSLLRRAGAIVLAKGNVPQLGIFHEADNPRHGCSKNPWDTQRTCSGSTGGDAALVASGGVPLALGSDLGGSIRLPAHACGIHGLMPTPSSVSDEGALCLGLGHALDLSLGPLARHVEDLVAAYNAMAARPPATPLVPSRRRPTPLRLAYWEEDAFFPVSPAIRRTLRSARQALSDQGVDWVEWTPPPALEIAELFLALLSADGGDEARRAVSGSVTDRRIARMLMLQRLPQRARNWLARLVEARGQAIEAHFLRAAGRQTLRAYWKLRHRLAAFRRRVHREMREIRIDAVLMPADGLPALPHGRSVDLFAAHVYAFLPNLLGYPAGVVSLSRVRPDEESDRPASRDRVLQLAGSCEQGTAGLPVAVQIMAGAWQEETVVAVMRCLEQAHATRDDYPPRVVLP